MYDTSRADWSLEQHTASLACSVQAEGSHEWAACRQMVLHMLSTEKLHKELIAALEADDDWKLAERLSRQHSRSFNQMRRALHELMDLQTQRAAAMRQ